MSAIVLPEQAYRWHCPECSAHSASTWATEEDALKAAIAHNNIAHPEHVGVVNEVPC